MRKFLINRLKKEPSTDEMFSRKKWKTNEHQWLVQRSDLGVLRDNEKKRLVVKATSNFQIYGKKTKALKFLDRFSWKNSTSFLEVSEFASPINNLISKKEQIKQCWFASAKIFFIILQWQLLFSYIAFQIATQGTFYKAGGFWNHGWKTTQNRNVTCCCSRFSLDTKPLRSVAYMVLDFL